MGRRATALSQWGLETLRPQSQPQCRRHPFSDLILISEWKNHSRIRSRSSIICTLKKSGHGDGGPLFGPLVGLGLAHSGGTGKLLGRVSWHPSRSSPKRVKELACEEPKPLQTKSSVKEAGEKIRSLHTNRLSVVSGDRVVGVVESKYPERKAAGFGHDPETTLVR
jgi:hypothetical protein